MTEAEFLAEYLTARRKIELDTIRDLTSRLIDAENKVWMITLVTKQDLWWKERETVREHYTVGEYNDCIEKVLAQRGRQNFQHEYLSASLVLSNFRAGDEGILVPITEGYDQNLQFVHLDHLANTLEGFTGS